VPFPEDAAPHDRAEDGDYPGRRRGLPASGPGAVAGWGRRLGALGIDWVLSTLAAAAIFGQGVIVPPETGRSGIEVFAPILVLGFEVWVLTTLRGGSAGQLVVGVTVRRMSGAPLDIFRALLRTFLMLLVIPPVIYNREQQGLHDLAVDSIALRTR
jgi:uncharacterized RDD family membrane protein YckC